MLKVVLKNPKFYADLKTVFRIKKFASPAK
jgi:hypothetical protein